MPEHPPTCPDCGATLGSREHTCDDATATSPIPTPLPSASGCQIVSHLGSGGMGSVYLATETALRRRVAVKMLSEKLAEDPDARARFLREARSMATVEHPNVVRIYSFGESDDNAYIVMEYVEGETLAGRIRREGKLGVDDALEITRQIVEGLEGRLGQEDRPS